MNLIGYLLAFLTPGAFLYIDLLAAATNALNSALLELLKMQSFTC